MKKKKLIGFPLVIANQLAPLNTSDYFKENYGTDDYTLLIIANDAKRAAFITIKEGTVLVEQVKKKNIEELKDLKKKADGRIETDIESFLKLAMGKLNPVKAILKGQLKVKGIGKILKFVKYLS